MPIPPLTAAQRAVIERMLYDQGSRLFIPMASSGAPNPEPAGFPDGSESMVPPTYTDVSGKPSWAADLYEELLATDPSAAIYTLASLNILLDKSGKDADVQQAAVERYVRPEFRSPVADASAPRPNYPFIINRLGAMIALKGIIGVDRPSDGATPGDQYQIGDLVLRANQFISGTRFDGAVERQSDLDLAAEMICTWDITNPRDLGYETARMHRMLELLDGSDPTVATLKAKLGIVTADLRFGGVPLLDFLAIVFGIIALEGSLPADLLLANPGSAVINSKTLLANVKLSQAALDTFLDNRSISVTDLKEKLASGKPWTAEEYELLMSKNQFRTDFLPFRQFPLVAMSPTEYVVPNLQFLTELMFSGLFFELFYSFPSKKRDLFSSLWGRLFELSLFESLEYFYPQAAGILRLDVDFEGGQVDALLDFGEFIVVFEFKHFLLLHETKYSRDAELLKAEIKKKLLVTEEDNAKAIRQLAISAAAIRSGSIETLFGKDTPVRPPAPIFPVVVVADHSLEAPFVNTYCNELFQIEAAGANVEPLTLMSIHEFENTLPVVSSGQIKWSELLASRFNGKKVKSSSVNQARYTIAKAKGLARSHNEFRRGQFAAIYNQLLVHYFGEIPPGAGKQTGS